MGLQNSLCAVLSPAVLSPVTSSCLDFPGLEALSPHLMETTAWLPFLCHSKRTFSRPHVLFLFLVV